MGGGGIDVLETMLDEFDETYEQEKSMLFANLLKMND